MTTKLTPEQLKEILTKHKLWLAGDPNGVRADPRYVDWRGTNLRHANLSGADLRGADLRGADLRNAWYIDLAKRQPAER